jgi:hypothetical protein
VLTERLSRIVVFALVLTQLVSPCRASQQAFIPEKYKGIILYAPEPEIPAIGYSNNMVAGTGVYRLSINQKTGLVDEVKVVRTLGWQRIDGSAIWALFQWKFRPRTIKQLDVPIWYGRTFEVQLKDATSR